MKSYVYCDDGIDCTNITDPTSSSLKISSASKLRKAIDNYEGITYNYTYDGQGKLTSLKKGAIDYISTGYDAKDRPSTQSVSVVSETLTTYV